MTGNLDGPHTDPEREAKAMSPGTVIRGARRLRLRLSIRGLMGLVALGGLLAHFVVLPMRERALKAGCLENLKAIGVALHAYHAAYGCFPPAYVADAQGRPVH